MPPSVQLSQLHNMQPVSWWVILKVAYINILYTCIFWCTSATDAANLDAKIIFAVFMSRLLIFIYETLL